MAMKVADLLVEVLAEAGVQRIYGVVGDSLNGITDSIRARKNLDWIHVRHEETAAFAAGAEAQITGRLAACAGSCGPGNLHLINRLLAAHRSMAAGLAIAAQIPSSEIGTGYFQETHPDWLFAECSHYSELISHPEQMPRVLQTAIQHAIGRSGVAVVSLPGDIAGRQAPQRAAELALVTRRPTICPSEEEVAALARMVDEAQRVTLFCGSGTAGAPTGGMGFARRVKCPARPPLAGKE